jgi:hypothetical protein
MGSLQPIGEPECFGTGLRSSGKPQRERICDQCRVARRCLLRRVARLEAPTLPDPQAWDAFVPAPLRWRRRAY